MASSPGAAVQRSLKVLLAEDNPVNQRVAVGLLQSLGHVCVVVGDGQKALQCLERLRFDLVLLDVVMPLMDGLEALARLRAQERRQGAARLPVVMVTAQGTQEDVQRFREAGADGYLGKPLDLGELRAELTRLLGP